MIPETQKPFLSRLWIYQRERFPVFMHGLLILMFTFSAISYSRICANKEGFIDPKDFIVGFFTTFSLFFLLRIADEHKDKDIDARYRKELPVPRGLIKLTELRNVGIAIICIQLAVILLVHPLMLPFYILILVYLALMTKEFFIHDWLNDHMWAYVGSHMVIMPLIDLYASGLDWYLVGDKPHLGLVLFFAVSYFNGIVLEVGRKLKPPADEKERVVTYSQLLGYKKAGYVWIFMIFITAIMASLALYYGKSGYISYVILCVVLLISIVFGLLYINNPSKQRSKLVEIISGVWTLLMYGTLGGVPGFLNFLL